MLITLTTKSSFRYSLLILFNGYKISIVETNILNKKQQTNEINSDVINKVSVLNCHKRAFAQERSHTFAF